MLTALLIIALIFAVVGFTTAAKVFLLLAFGLVVVAVVL